MSRSGERRIREAKKAYYIVMLDWHIQLRLKVGLCSLSIMKTDKEPFIFSTGDHCYAAGTL